MTLAGGEIVPALERGAIDGAEWVNCSDDKILGIDKIAKFHYAPGMHEPVTVGEFIINKAQVGRAAGRPEGDRQDLRPGLVLEPLRPVPGEDGEGVPGDARLRRQDHQDDRRAERQFLKAYDEIVAANVAKDEFYKKVIDSQKKYSSLVVPYRLSYWPNYNFIAEHYYKDKIWLK